MIAPKQRWLRVSSSFRSYGTGIMEIISIDNSCKNNYNIINEVDGKWIIFHKKDESSGRFGSFPINGNKSHFWQLLEGQEAPEYEC